MSVTRIASRYAKSLIELAQDQNKFDRITEDVLHFQAATEVRDLYLLLKSPIINGSKKKQILEILFAKDFDEVTMAFLSILIRKGREQFLPEIAGAYMKQYRDIKGISTVTLTTASTLSQETIDAIHQKIASSGLMNARLEIKNKVNEDILGGFVLEFEDRLYDASAAHKLNELKKGFVDNKFVKK